MLWRVCYIGCVMASPAVPLLSPALLQYVDKVWTENGKQAIPSANKVYDLYGDSNLPSAQPTWGLVDKFADALLELQRVGGGDCELAWQTNMVNDGWERDQTRITSAFTTMKAEANAGGASLSPPTEALVYDDFVHFKNVHAAGATKERVYIHLSPPIPENGLKVMRALLAMFPTNPAMTSAKICGAGATDRVDSIVVYLTSNVTADAVVNALSQNAALHGCFERGVPFVVNEVTQGIGRAQEPPVTSPLYADDGISEHPLRKNPKVDFDRPGHAGSIGFETKNTSFGTLHAELIFTGLQQWRKKNAAAPLTGAVPQTLLTEIVAVYRSEGYDPTNPSQFPNRQQIEADFQGKMSTKFFAKGVDPSRIGQAKTV